MLLTDEDVNAESFETWNAKQHGDPEEIGFLQALRIAYCCGQDSMKKAVERAVIEKLCAWVVMPEAAGSFHVTHFRQSARMRNIEFQEHFAFAEGDHSLYTADKIRAYGAAQRVKALEDAAVCAEGYPKYGESIAEEIRALKGEA